MDNTPNSADEKSRAVDLARYIRNKYVVLIGMNSKREIVPWICHVCNKAFHVDSGGLCSKCHKATCLRCLGVGTFSGILKRANFETAVCRHCADTEQDKVRKKPV